MCIQAEFYILDCNRFLYQMEINFNINMKKKKCCSIPLSSVIDMYVCKKQDGASA